MEIMASIPVVLALGHDSSKPIASNRIRLLEGIAQSGSITQAAISSDMSYRSALASIEALEELADCRLVVKTVGGKHGGGAELTADGHKLIASYRLIEKFQAELVGFLGEHQGILYAYNKMMLKTSARNQLQGSVSAIDDHEDIVDCVWVDLSPELRVAVSVTKESTAELGLRPGVEVSLLIKAPAIRLVTTASPGPGVNRVPARIQGVQVGGRKSRLKLGLTDGIGVSAIVDSDSLPMQGVDLEGRDIFVDIDAEAILIGISF